MPSGLKTRIGSSDAGARGMVAGQSAVPAAFGVDDGDSYLELPELAGDACPLHTISGSTGNCLPDIQNCADKAI